MDETALQENFLENLLFSLLGGICAIIVGFAIFGATVKNDSVSRSPSSEQNWVEFIDSLPVLD